MPVGFTICQPPPSNRLKGPLVPEGDHQCLTGFPIVATINCQISKLDPAITRPGRLLAYRNFGRLPADQARRLAARKGLRLPDQPDYSLAEIYNGSPVESAEFNPRTIGFAA